MSLLAAKFIPGLISDFKSLTPVQKKKVVDKFTGYSRGKLNPEKQ